MDDEYLIDDNEELEEDGYFQSNSPDDEDVDEDIESADEDQDLIENVYTGKLGEQELRFLLGYDDIVSIGKRQDDNAARPPYGYSISKSSTLKPKNNQ